MPLLSTMLLATGLAAGAPECRHPAAQIAAMEIRFSRQSAEEGLNAAFAANLADDAVDFAPAPRESARQYYAGQPEPPVALGWHPAWTLAAASGDFGISTGPYTLSNEEGSPIRYGQYASVWQQGLDGQWKVTIDAGIAHSGADDAPALDPAHMAPAGVEAEPEWAGAPADVLLEADRGLSRAAVRMGSAHAIISVATEEVRLLRDGQFPAIGRAPVGVALRELDAPWAWQPWGADIASSGDLGYTYGISMRAGKERNAYLHVWQRGPQGWRLVLLRESPLSADQHREIVARDRIIM